MVGIEKVVIKSSVSVLIVARCGLRLEAISFQRLISSLYERQGRLHQCDTTMLPGIFIGYVLNSGGSWPGVIFAASVTASRPRFRVKRFESKDVGIKNSQEVSFVCADGSSREEGHAQRQTSRH